MLTCNMKRLNYLLVHLPVQPFKTEDKLLPLPQGQIDLRLDHLSLHKILDSK